MKKIRVLSILCMALALTALFILADPTEAKAATVTASGTCGDDLTWTLDDEGTLTISGTGDMTKWLWKSEVPWDSYRSSIKNVIIKDGVTRIGNLAFEQCYSLTTVTIGGGVTRIGDSAFSFCTNLTTVNIGKGVTRIGDAAFYNCNSLTTIEIPDSTIGLGNQAFSSCDSLTTIEIPDSVTSIGLEAFAYCDSLTEIKFTGNAPVFGWIGVFRDVTATAYYPADDATWTEEVRQNYGGTITWVPYSVGNENKGDFDGDGEITNKDVEYLLWYTLFPESYPIETDADLNGDGQVDNLDVEYLLWHTLFPDSYPL